MAEKSKVTILHTDAIIELYYTLYPFLVSDQVNERFKFVYFDSNKLKNISGETVLFLRIFKGKFDEENFVNETLQQLKQSFDKVCFLDDSAGADSTHFEFIDSVDKYYKAKVLTDTEFYKKRLYGRQLFSDYYHRRYNITDGEDEYYREPVQYFNEINNLKPAFNLGYGWYPKPATNSPIRSLGYFLTRVNRFDLMRPFFLKRHSQLIEELDQSNNYHAKIPKVSVRFRYENYPKSIGYQRLLFEKIIQDQPNFLTGIIPQNEYLNELKNTLATLSPFGYGEVCVRDFECILNGSLLIKPDMSHLITKPNIYIPHETYIPLKWDGSDLLDVVDNVLSTPEKYHTVIENARFVYRQSLVDIEDEFMSVFGELFH